MSEPHNKDVQGHLKWCFDSLESQDVELSSEQRSKHVNNRRGNIQSSSLYYLYPVAISTDSLINCWWTEESLGEHDTCEEAYNKRMTIESLNDVCLLETHSFVSVKMHDAVHDVAVCIAMG